MAGMMGGGMMDNEAAPMDAGDDGGEMASLEARVSAIEAKLGMGAPEESAPAPAMPMKGGKPASPFYGG